jgi:hypothetical protein
MCRTQRLMCRTQMSSTQRQDNLERPEKRATGKKLRNGGGANSFLAPPKARRRSWRPAVTDVEKPKKQSRNRHTPHARPQHHQSVQNLKGGCAELGIQKSSAGARLDRTAWDVPGTEECAEECLSIGGTEGRQHLH